MAIRGRPHQTIGPVRAEIALTVQLIQRCYQDKTILPPYILIFRLSGTVSVMVTYAQKWLRQKAVRLSGGNANMDMNGRHQFYIGQTGLIVARVKYL